jgi:hypothetical protein
MWPSLWTSAVMGGAVLCIGIFFQNLPQQLLLIIQILYGIVIYIALMIYSQRNLVSEIKEMVWSKKGSA